MDRLILMRHGDAESGSLSGEDFDRNLTAVGERESREVAGRLADMGLSPDLALVSDAARARQTWTCASSAFPGARAVYIRDLYLASPEAILEVVARESPPARTVIVIGHNPGLQELAVELLSRASAPPHATGRAQARFPTAAAGVFLFDENGRPWFDGLFLPSGGF